MNDEFGERGVVPLLQLLDERATDLRNLLIQELHLNYRNPGKPVTRAGHVILLGEMETPGSFHLDSTVGGTETGATTVRLDAFEKAK